MEVDELVRGDGSFVGVSGREKMSGSVEGTCCMKAFMLREMMDCGG